MANWTAVARSNYFFVEDEDAFRADMDRLGLTVVRSHNNESVAVLADELDSGWPINIYDEDSDEEYDVDIVCEVAGHLAEGQVAVFMETGHEKFRYTTGFAVAVNRAGETRRVSLEDIFNLAEELAGPGVEVTDAAY